MPSFISSSNSEVPHRDIPAQSWGIALFISISIMIIGVTGWEINMRSQGLTTDDIDDGSHYWAVERRKIDEAKTGQIAIVGASRILFDTDLDIFEEIAGTRPVQLALPGTPPLKFIQDIAEDEDFTGLLIVGYTPGAVFRQGTGGEFGIALDVYKTQAPSKRVGHEIFLILQHTFAFMDFSHSLFKEIAHAKLENRQGIRDPNLRRGGWKLAVNGDDRQTFMWDKVLKDKHLREQHILRWGPERKRGYIEDSILEDRIAVLKEHIVKIRIKGGDVAFVRLPSIGFLYAREAVSWPRDRAWDKLMKETGAANFHFNDHILTTDMKPPEYSHLNKTDAQIFTRVYVSSLMKQLNRQEQAD